MPGFADVLGTGIGPQAAAAPAGMPYTGMAESGPNEFLAQINKPAQSPEELTERKTLWQSLVEKINSDPNLQNSMMMMGAQLMQPQAPGQTPAGHVGQALGTGFQTYKAGEYSQYEQARTGQEAARKERETGAQIGATEALTRERTRATEQARQLEETERGKAKAELETIQLRLRESKSQADVDALERDIKKRRAGIEQTIPDERLRAARLVELDKMAADVAEARGRAKSYEAAAGLTKAKTQMEQKEIDALPTDPELLRQYFTKSGAYASTATSGVVQQGQFWGNLYDKLPADDPEKKDKTREQYMAHMLKKATEKSILETYLKAVQYLEPNDEILETLRAAAQGALDRPTQKGAPKAKGKEELKFTDLGNGYERAVRPDGTIVLRRLKRTAPSMGVTPITTP